MASNLPGPHPHPPRKLHFCAVWDFTGRVPGSGQAGEGKEGKLQPYVHCHGQVRQWDLPLQRPLTTMTPLSTHGFSLAHVSKHFPLGYRNPVAFCHHEATLAWGPGGQWATSPHKAGRNTGSPSRPGCVWAGQHPVCIREPGSWPVTSGWLKSQHWGPVWLEKDMPWSWS